MSTPPQRRLSKRKASPKEDGEIGESAADVLERHPLLTPSEGMIVKGLRQYEDEFTPEVSAAIGRLLSAALSPMAIKAVTVTVYSAKEHRASS